MQVKMLSCPGDPKSRAKYLETCPGNLTRALQAVDQLWWVGVTEMYNVSVCILGFKLEGAVDARYCDCRQGRVHSAVKPANTYDQRSVEYHRASSCYPLPAVKALEERNNEGAVLHAYAMARVLREAREVETQTGVKLLC
jgi:hypothetical protein